MKRNNVEVDKLEQPPYHETNRNIDQAKRHY